MGDRETEHAIFDTLIADMEDPVLNKVLANAHDWDSQFRIRGVDVDELKESAEYQLKRDWKQWSGKAFDAVGFAHRVIGDENDIRPDIVLLEPGQKVTSLGFSVILTDVDGIHIDGNPYGEQYRVVHNLRRQVEGGGAERLIAFLGNIDLKSDVMSFEYASQWLQRKEPEYFARLGRVINNDRSPIFSLPKIGSNCDPRYFLDVFNQKARAATEQYINGAIDIDTKVPYIITTKAKRLLYERDDEGNYTTKNGPLRVVGRLSNVTFLEVKASEYNHGAGDWRLSVNVRVYGENVLDNDKTIALPLSSLRALRSLRELGYGALRHLEIL